MEDLKISDVITNQVIQVGIGIMYEGQEESERDLIKLLYKEQVIQVIIVTQQIEWQVTEHAFLTVILDNSRFDGQEKRYVDYTIPDML